MQIELLLLLYVVLYFFCAFVWSSPRAYRKTGKNPIVLATTDDAYGYVARSFKVLMGLLLMYAILLNSIDNAHGYLGALAWLDAPWLSIVGWSLLLCAFALTLKSQIDMGASWRIGIDTKHRTELITTGAFAWSRNPIYLSMRMALLGQFLCLPSAVTLVFLALGEVLMQTQVRLEEAHLTQINGADYTHYQSTVRRWL